MSFMKNKFVTQFFCRIRYNTSELCETTLLTSGGILQEVRAVWQGHSLNIIKSLRDVDNLKVDLEVCSFNFFLHGSCILWNR